MARGVSWGTPGRSAHYAPLRPKWKFLGPALILGLGALALPLALHAIGWRGSLSPGAVTSPHAPFEAGCEECHTPRAGVADARCQRCHDASGAGRLTGAAHVLFGSGDARKAAASAPPPCVGCHVDHQGRGARLAAVDQRQCGACHFRSLSAHPEFALLRESGRDEPGIQFPHERHMRELAKQNVAEKDACLRCHEPAGAHRDLQPIAFDRHCASCHEKNGSIGLVEPIPLEDVVAPAQLMARGGVNFRIEEFEESRGRIAKTALRHRDDWVVFNLRQLWRGLDAAGFAAARSALAAREAQLVRRQALAAPLAGLDVEALQSREAALAAELEGLEARLAGQAQAAST
ncbi:MAG: cytochrome c3 family protein, partial [Burkholderiales bacterium]